MEKRDCNREKRKWITRDHKNIVSITWKSGISTGNNTLLVDSECKSIMSKE